MPQDSSAAVNALSEVNSDLNSEANSEVKSKATPSYQSPVPPPDRGPATEDQGAGTRTDGGGWLVEAWHRLPKRQRVLGAICLIQGLLVAMILLAPLTLPAGTVDLGEEGVVPRNDFHDEREEAGMSGWVEFIYWAGDVNCHQKHERSPTLNGNQLPFCARCTAIFIGLLGGMALYFRRSYPLPFWTILAGLVPMGLDGGTQLFNFYESTNWLRTLTGGMAGFTLGMVIAHMGTDISYSRSLNRAWKEGRPYVQPPLPMPETYFRAFVAAIILSCWITAMYIAFRMI